MSRTVLITGAAGIIGEVLRVRLDHPGRTLKLFDIVPLQVTHQQEEVILGSIADVDSLVEAMRGADAVIHLAGLRTEAPWDDILHVNVTGTRNVLEAARITGCRRVILASSNHAVGFFDRTGVGDDGLPEYLHASPDTYYGVSKAAMEALGSLYHHRFGIDVVCLRIGSCTPTPANLRALSIWISPDDMGRLAEAALTLVSPGFRIVWGISRNTRRWWSLAEGKAIGYEPFDDAERFVAQLDGAIGAEPDPILRFVGGEFCEMPLGQHPQGSLSS